MLFNAFDAFKYIVMHCNALEYFGCIFHWTIAARRPKAFGIYMLAPEILNEKKIEKKQSPE